MIQVISSKKIFNLFLLSCVENITGRREKSVQLLTGEKSDGLGPAGNLSTERKRNSVVYSLNVHKIVDSGGVLSLSMKS